MLPIVRQMGDYDGIFEDCMGRSGGLAMLWHKSVKVTFLSKSFHHIDVQVNHVGLEGAWRFIGVYGWLESGLKLRTREMIKDLALQSSLSWLIGGSE